jgi:hypothetical protein
MAEDKEAIATRLKADNTEVLALRARAAGEPALAQRLPRLKAWQAGRLERTYADLLANDRYRPATTFFLQDLYGARDFSQRDEQLSRVVPVMCKMLPASALATIGAAVGLDRLSESLDQDVARALNPGPDAIDGDAYARAYRAAGRRRDREQQIEQTGEIGATLDRLTRSRSLRGALSLMSGPAHAAGFGALQDFLERGFAAFRHMHGADEFLAIVIAREREIMQRLFDTRPDPFGEHGLPV